MPTGALRPPWGPACAGMSSEARANGVAAKAVAKVAVTGKAEREQLRQMPLTARAEAAVAKARACATVAGMRALSLCGPLGDSEPEPWLHPLTEERQRLRKMLMARAEAAVAKARACAAVDAMRTLSLDSPLGSSELEPRLQPRSEDRQHLAQLEPARGDETAEALLGSPTGGRLGRQGAKAYSGPSTCGEPLRCGQPCQRTCWVEQAAATGEAAAVAASSFNMTAIEQAAAAGATAQAT